MDAQKALLLIDFQKDFVDPEGKLPVPNISDFMRNIPVLADNFRSKGSVIWVRTEYAQPRLAISPETGSASILLKQNLDAGSDTGSHHVSHLSQLRYLETDVDKLFQSIIHQDAAAFLDRSYSSSDVRPCMPGTSGVELPSTLSSVVDPKVDMEVVKSDYSAFAETQLLLQLRTRLITHVYVCGSLSNISVYATVLDAVRHGLEVTLVEDCLGSLDPKCHLEAMKQMADDMGASGVDYQELMDDLSGLLGDVIREENFPSRFQVSIQPQATVPPAQRNQRVEDWLASAGSKRREPAIESHGTHTNPSHQRPASRSNESHPKTKASKRSSGKGTPELSPPRKRSTSDVDNTEEGFIPQDSQTSTIQRQLHSTPSVQRRVNSKPRLRNTRSSQGNTPRPPPSLVMQALQSKSTSDIPDKPEHSMLSDTDSQGPSVASPKTSTASLPQHKKQKKNRQSKEILGATDTIGEGDCRLINDLVLPTEADFFFHLLKDNVRWQKMYHRSGEVPRLVAVQGHASSGGDGIPIYRHPADESPELLPFDASVDALRQIAEKRVGHPLNHVLIQWYRNGEDNISEHSDKTLDIVRDSKIVNVSLGAQRTMTMRTKKQVPNPTAASKSPVGIPPELETLDPAPRTTQRISLPHASLFVLGQATNQHWLHAIRSDKRPLSEKLPEELAFDGERISLTFRDVGTFIDPHTKTIWGQGATNKTRETAEPILQGEEADKEGEKMIKAFGVENHSSKEWRWEEWYGEGFDVVNFQGHEMQKDERSSILPGSKGGTRREQHELLQPEDECAMTEQPTPSAGGEEAESACDDTPSAISPCSCIKFGRERDRSNINQVLDYEDHSHQPEADRNKD